ncbi:MAG: NADP oxidoreductase [Ignavibacteriae bacterium]|nr:NADP oxidoreductase [Ignavibacteriota bacterium]
MAKIKIATAWLGGCSGCHMSFLDLDERLIDLHGRAELVYSPIMDVKVFPAGVDVTLVEGAVANSDNLELLETIRRNSRILVAFGDCAVTGNVTAMRNGLDRDEILRDVYGELGVTFGKQDGTVLPVLHESVTPIHKVVSVDAYLPGCPPDADLIWYVITELLEGRQPVLTEDLLKYG